MDDRTETFLIPEEEYLAEQRRFLATMAGVMVAAILFVTWLSTGDLNIERLTSPLTFVLMLTGPAVLIMLAAGALQSRSMLREWRQTKLHIGPVGIVRENGAAQEVVLWGNITRVRICRNLRGTARFIELSVAGAKPMVLIGFAPMADVAEKIKGRVPPTTQVTAKRYAVDGENPLVWAACLCTGMLTLQTVYRLGGEALLSKVNLAIAVALGIRALVRGHMSRTNPNRTKSGLASAAFLLLITLWFYYRARMVR
jgi:hypothetical protein